MPKQITKTVYEYAELTDKAKERAREWFFRSGLPYDDAWEMTKEDAEQIGLKIEALETHRANSGDFIVSALDCAERIIQNHGHETETYKTAAKYAAVLKSENDDDTDSAHEFLRDLLEDYRVYHQKDVEYRESEEYVAEMMEANGYTFDENGRRDG